jgi:S-adenosyl methyltransferase
MADQSLGKAGSDQQDIPGINTTVPHPARVYDYFLGGTDNFEADRVAAEAAIKAFPRTAESAFDLLEPSLGSYGIRAQPGSR